MNEIKKLNAIITGASSGIGKTISIALASEGVNLILCGRNETRLNETTSQCMDKGVNVYTFCKDLSSVDAINELHDLSLSCFEQTDILINCAGIAQNSPFTEITESQFDSIMLTNVKIPFMLMQKTIPDLRKSHGTIINICSVVAHKGYPNQSIYSASKHALLGMSKAIANEEFKNDVRVHVICPGAVLTDMVKLTRPDLVGTNMISAEDVSDSVIYLLKHRSSAGVIDEINIHRSMKDPFI